MTTMTVSQYKALGSPAGPIDELPEAPRFLGLLVRLVAWLSAR